MGIYRPGDINIDKDSQVGHTIHGARGVSSESATPATHGESHTRGTSQSGSSDRPSWPDLDTWSRAITSTLNRIRANPVGGILLRAMIRRPRTPHGRPAVYIVPTSRMGVAITDGIFPPHTGANTTNDAAIFITYSRPDSYGRDYDDRDPMSHPVPVLTHELTHALMSIHGLNTRLEPDGSEGPLSRWHTATYPNHNEFCATTIQNMLLSSAGVLLSDGYQLSIADDPIIESNPLNPIVVGPLGIRADSSGTDVAAFVERYRQPLEFLAGGLPDFTSQLARLPGVRFNPFKQMRRAATSGGSGRSRTRGRARVPGPLRFEPGNE